MLRRFLLFALLLSFVYAIFFMSPQGAPGEENPYTPLYSVMDKSQAQVTHGELQYWAHLHGEEEINSVEDLERKADDILASLTSAANVSENAAGSRQKSEDAAFKKTDGVENLESQEGQDSQQLGSQEPLQEDSRENYQQDQEVNVAERMEQLPGYGTLRLLLQDMKINGERNLHLLVTVTQEGRGGSLGQLSQRLPALLESEVKDSTLSFCLTGHIEQKLNQEEIEELALQLAHSLQGEQLEKVQEEKMISVTGYTPELDTQLQFGDQRLNLNLALRYDDHLQKTVIFAATPLIPRCY